MSAYILFFIGGHFFAASIVDFNPKKNKSHSYFSKKIRLQGRRDGVEQTVTFGFFLFLYNPYVCVSGGGGGREGMLFNHVEVVPHQLHHRKNFHQVVIVQRQTVFAVIQQRNPQCDKVF